MRLSQLELFQLSIPFRFSFKHASAERSVTESVWVEARTPNGTTGYGEACPRSYVTGEDVSTVAGFFTRHRDEIVERVHELSDLGEWAREHEEEIDAHPAAWCAIEMALLDALAKERELSVDALLGRPELSGTFRYTAVLGDMRPQDFSRLFQRYVGLGFEDFKVKLSGDLEHDRESLACMSGHRVRADANNLWDSVEEAVRYLEALEFPFWALEEPLAPGDYEGLERLSGRLETPLVLDESFLRPAQLDCVPRNGIVNVRVSKMGGLLRSLATVERAKRRGVGIVVGAQVGETGLLTRAALPVAMAAGDALLAQEGAFGTFLLEHDVCRPSLTWGRGGELRAPEPEGFGFGLVMSGHRRFLRELV